MIIYPTKALSIRQPWAELIFSGKKTIEMRSWITSYRGPLWLHVPKKKDVELEHYFGFNNLPTGEYLGYFTLAAVLPITIQRWEEWRSKHRDPGPYQYGQYAWFVRNPMRFTHPIAGAGQLRLFDPDPEIQRRLESAVNK